MRTNALCKIGRPGVAGEVARPDSVALLGHVPVQTGSQGFYEPTFVKSVNLGVISGGLTREETKRTRS
jgi:hypothetical protein